MRNLDVYPVKAPELPLALNPQGPLDGVDADIVGYRCQVLHGTLFDLFDKARAFGRRSIVCQRPCSSYDRQQEQKSHFFQSITSALGSQADHASEIRRSVVTLTGNV